MTKVLINDGHVGWLADRDALLSALDGLGWEEAVVAGHKARIEPDHYDGSKPPYAKLCDAVDDVAGDFADADLEFVYLADQEAWIWRVIVPAFWPETDEIE